MYNFEFAKPKTVAAAASAMAAEGAQALGGGQTLLPTMKQRLAAPEVLVSMTDVEGMVGVRADGDRLTIGGATTHAAVAAATACSLACQALQAISAILRCATAVRSVDHWPIMIRQLAIRQVH